MRLTRNVKFALIMLLAMTVFYGGLFLWGVYSTASKHKEAVLEFWGDDFTLDEDAKPMIDIGWPHHLMFIPGGHYIATWRADCGDNALYPMTPVRYDDQDRPQVLCGVASDDWDVRILSKASMPPDIASTMDEILTESFGRPPRYVEND